MRVRVERPDDACAPCRSSPASALPILLSTIDVGEFDLLDEQVDQRPIVAVARRLAAIAQEIGGGIVLRADWPHRPPSPSCRAVRRRRGSGPPRRGTRRWRRPAAARRCRSIRSAGSRSDLRRRAGAPPARRSSRSVQQMQPLVISTSFSSVRERLAPPSRTSAASMFTSLMSLTMTATRRPSRLLRTWLSSVVLPAPRKPESTVTGRRGSARIEYLRVILLHWMCKQRGGARLRPFVRTFA